MKFKHRGVKLLVSLAASGGIIAITAAPASAGPWAVGTNSSMGSL